MKAPTEKSAVQSPLVDYAEAVGWRPLSRDAATTERRGETGTLLNKTLERKLIDLNPGVVTSENVREVIERIETVRPSIEGNYEILRWLRGEQTVKDPRERRTRNVTVIDFEHLDSNVFHVTEEWEYTNGRHSNRADVMFLINGIPVAIVETKHAKKPDAIDRGLKQIRDYHAETPEMLAAPQVFDLTRLVEFYYGATWSLDRKAIFNWKEEESGNFERKVKRFFGLERFLRMLRDWIIFYRRDDELQKIILRQHQTRAVDKVVARALDPEKTRGLVWHTQGSGKTFTMFAAAELLLEHPALRNEKPTVILMVDRRELEYKTVLDLGAYGLPVIQARSKRHLRQLLKNDTRGLILSMIHKFDGADANLSTSDRIFVLIDEAHRTTGGTLGNYLVAALPKATIIGFTGTPIDKTAYGEGTFKIFGRDDQPQGFLDKYSIAESLADGTTLELKYTLAKSDLRVPVEILEREFLKIQDDEAITDIEQLNAILENAIRTKEFLKADNRIAVIAEFVAGHFREHVEPYGFKAFLVGVDREACALYKEELDKHLPAEYSAVVISANPEKDTDLERRYLLEEDEEKAIRRAFRSKSSKPFATRVQSYSAGFPKILIVTEKLLTGFDAPILYCMYLDKPMRDHTLLQAIARVNRPYTDPEDETNVKPAGLIIDFVGIFNRLEDALRFDKEEVKGVVENVDVLKRELITKLENEAPAYVSLIEPPYDDKTVEQLIAKFQERDEREAFYTFFRDAERLYEIVSPDPDLRPHLDTYLRLAELHALVRGVFAQSKGLLGDVMRKTAQLVREKVSIDRIEAILRPVTINEETLRALRESGDDDPAKAIHLGRSVIRTIREEPEEPYLVTLSERAERVLELIDDNQQTTAEALTELEEILRLFDEAMREKRALNLDDSTFRLFQTLKQAGLEPADAQEVAAAVSALFGKYPEQADNAGQQRQLKIELYGELVPRIGKEPAKDVARRLIESAPKGTP
ncbi:MAG: type I restriction endonuclease subunit R [Thermoanaerobaculia bacterium]